MSDFTDKTLITEDDIRTVPAGTTVRVNEKVLITPLAADLARERHISIERVPTPGKRPRRTIAIGADHGGFEMKERLKSLLAELGCDLVQGHLIGWPMPADQLVERLLPRREAAW